MMKFHSEVIMTIQEFKAWLDGFSHNIIDCPTIQQWKHIKVKIAQLEDSNSNKYTIPNFNLPQYSPNKHFCDEAVC